MRCAMSYELNFQSDSVIRSACSLLISSYFHFKGLSAIVFVRKTISITYQFYPYLLHSGIIFDFFNSEANIEKLVEFLSLEEKKGRDKFNAIRFTLFKVCYL